MSDFLDDEETQNALKQTTLADITEPVKKALKLADRMEKGTKLLEELKAEYEDLTGNVIPNIMANADCYETVVADEEGNRFKVAWKEDVRAGLPVEDADARDRALAFLKENQAGDIIKGDAEIVLPPNEDVEIFDEETGEDKTVNLRQEFIKALQEFAQLQGVLYTTKEGVHAATLAKWCREALALDGKSVASHTENELKASGLSVFVYKKTSIKRV
jgi:hypothetical protein